MGKVKPEPAIKSIKDWHKRNPGFVKSRNQRFEFGKLGLWEAWYNFPPQRDWLPPAVFERVRSVRIKYQTYWYVKPAEPIEHIDNKLRRPVAAPLVVVVAPLVAPPEAEDDSVCSPTLTESEDEAEIIESSSDDDVEMISIMDIPLLW
jgi:hypothetical protein